MKSERKKMTDIDPRALGRLLQNIKTIAEAAVDISRTLKKMEKHVRILEKMATETEQEEREGGEEKEEKM